MKKPLRVRKTLTLKQSSNSKSAEANNSENNDAVLQPVVNTIDFLLPCRDYVIDFKVADTKQLSITLEYILRLIRVLGRLREEEIAEFFNYDRKELEFVLNEGSAHEYIEWKNGEVDLARAGRKLFDVGSNVPRSMELQTFSSRVGFDLLSFSFERKKYLSRFDSFLPELEVKDTEFISDGSSGVPEVFKKNYFEIMVSDPRLKKEKKGLYSVDKVATGDRYSVLVPVDIRHDNQCLGQPDFDLGKWKDEADLGSRQAVLESISSYLSTLCRSRNPRDQVSFQVFRALIDDVLDTSSENVVDEAFSAEVIYKNISEHLLKDDGNSVFFGSPFLPKIGTELIGAIKDGMNQRKPKLNLSWLIPNTPAWGANQNFPSLLEGIYKELASEAETGNREKVFSSNDDEANSRMNVEWFVSGKLEKQISVAFQQHACEGHELSISNNLVEIIVCSNAAVLIAIHVPPTRGSAMPTPLGVISSNRAVVEKALDYLSRLSSTR